MYKWQPGCILEGIGAVHYNDFLGPYDGVQIVLLVFAWYAG